MKDWRIFNRGRNTASISEREKILVCHGTQTGNSRFIAEELCRYLRIKGIRTISGKMEAKWVKQLSEIQFAFFVVSTHGQGEPPEQAEEFFNYLRLLVPNSLKNLQYAICALGDRDYTYYCKAGRDLDHYLRTAGARSMFALTACDTDFREPATRWIGNVYACLSGKTILPPVTELSDGKAPIVWYDARVLDKQLLYNHHAERQCWHIRLKTEQPDLPFENGDTIGLLPENDPELVRNLLVCSGWTGKEQVELSGERMCLENALKYRIEITSLTPDLIRSYSHLAKVRGISLLLNHENCLKSYAQAGDVTDLLADYPSDITPQGLVELLPSLGYRYYSISSGIHHRAGFVEVAVRPICQNHRGRLRAGACSVPLGKLIPGDPLRFHIKKNPGFRLPDEGEASMIMIGAGTGIAPFRAFLQDRKSLKSGGRNWLIAGDAYRQAGILYQHELEKFRQDGLLDRLDMVFSKEGQRQTYVQDVVAENGKEIVKWLQDGAFLYICGSVNMAGGVRKALLDAFMFHRKYNLEKAEKFLFNLKLQHRLSEDVY